MTGFLSLIICIIGLVIYFVATHPKVSECGRVMLWTGLLAFLIANGSATVGLLK
jgi:Na+/phosphate symporter